MWYRALPFILLVNACAPVEEVGEQTQAVTGSTVVSLTFDDTFADQFQVGAMTEARGMRATFYVNSSRIGQSGSLSLAQVLALRDAGHEIGGHTITHAELAAVDTDEAKRQICNDRESLLANGFRITSFAYPFSSQNAAVRQLAADCGYNSARLVGGLVVPGSCSGCPYANPMPPVDPMGVRANDSIQETTTLDTMKLYVTQAEQHGGGWVPMVFHHVCDGCNELSVTPAQLAQFLDWLKARSAQGTVVATVDQVMGGSVKPAVTGPQIITNMIQNPSLETDANSDQVPDCWKRDGYGTNTSTYSLTSNAYSGSVAQKLDVTSFSSGGRRIVTAQDSGSCAPAVIPGHRYTFTARYIANAQPIVSVYLRSSSGSWSWFAESARLPTSSSYALATYTTPPIPSGATHISVGVSLISTGSLTTDQYTLVDANDGAGPSVSLSLPAANTSQSGLVEIYANASDPNGVARVEFLVNGSVVATDVTYPYWTAWNSAAFAGQTVTVAARAFDNAGNASTSASRQITIQSAGDTTPPTVAITSPANGAQVSGTVTITATASDAGGVARVEFYANGALLGSRTASPYTWGWNSVPYNGQNVTLMVRAIDNANNVASATRTVTVTSSADTTPPIVSLTSPANGAAVSGTVTLSADAVDPESGIARVEFFANGTLVATELNAPYELPWDTTPYAGQTVTLTARATDNQNNQATSSPRTITVTGGGSTVVAITSPPDGPTVWGTVTFSADASDPDGIARVEFLVDGTVVGSDTTSPYAIAWNTTPYSGQNVTLTARMVDVLNNATMSAPRLVGVEDSMPPTVTLTSPPDGVVVSGTVTISADASDAGGIARVDFIANGTVLATDISAPYSFQWDTAAYAGQSVTLTARAYDSSENATTSPTHVVSVQGDPNNPPPVVSVTSPAEQATVTGTITITANASDADGVARVEFYVQGPGPQAERELIGTDTTAPYSFAFNTDPYAGQTITLYATAFENTAEGKSTTSAARTVNVQGQAAWTIALTSPTNGATVNGTVTLTANASHGTIGVARVEFWAGSTLLGTDTTAPYSLAWDTSAYAGQSVTLFVDAIDNSGGGATSDEVTVTVGSSNMIRNASLETDANGDQVPDCWQRGGSGTNSATYALTNNAFAGSVAQRIDVTSLSSGARRIVTLQDSGTCAPAAAAGKRYTVTARYLANATTVFTVYYRNASGSWVWLAQSASQPTSSTYRLGTYTTPALPAGATHISVGLSIIAVGSVTMDDFTLVEAP
jgi:peptidoglycan/xylan/chitin deacetylase (PgdA/CDA1 family)